jgi:hypothetical protein
MSDLTSFGTIAGIKHRTMAWTQKNIWTTNSCQGHFMDLRLGRLRWCQGAMPLQSGAEWERSLSQSPAMKDGPKSKTNFYLVNEPKIGQI